LIAAAAAAAAAIAAGWCCERDVARSLEISIDRAKFQSALSPHPSYWPRAREFPRVHVLRAAERKRGKGRERKKREEARPEACGPARDNEQSIRARARLCVHT